MSGKEKTQFCLNVEQNSTKDLALMFAITAVTEKINYLLDPVVAYEGFFTKMFSKNKLLDKYLPVTWAFHGVMAERILFRTVTKLFKQEKEELPDDWFVEFHAYYWAYFAKTMQMNFSNMGTCSGEAILRSLVFYEGMPATLKSEKSLLGLLNLAKAISGVDGLPDISACVERIVPNRSAWYDLSIPTGTRSDVNELHERHWQSIKNTVLQYVKWLERSETNEIENSISDIKKDWDDVDKYLLTQEEVFDLLSKKYIEEFLNGNKPSYFLMKTMVGCSVFGEQLAKRVTLSILLDFTNRPGDYQEYLSERLSDEEKKYAQDLNFLFNVGVNVFKEETYAQGVESIARSLYKKLDSMPENLSPLGEDYGMPEIELGLHQVFVGTCELLLSYLPVFMVSKQGYEFVQELISDCHSRLPAEIAENMQDLIDHLDGTAPQRQALDYFLRHVCTNLLLLGRGPSDKYFDTVKAELYSYANMVATLFVQENEKYRDEEPSSHFVEEPEKMKAWIQKDFPWSF